MSATSAIIYEAYEAPTCRMCGAVTVDVVAELDDGVRYLACPCGVTYPAPFPSDEELEAVYAHGYMDLNIAGHGLHLRFKDSYRAPYRRERDQTLADIGMKPSQLRGKRILDIGCANGIFLDYLRTYGVSGVGIDISAEMVAAACDNGLDARTTPLQQIGGTWDVACLWDVIEHLTDPRAALEHIAALLPPGGELLIQTPCTGLISQSLADAWRNFTYPQHIHLFSFEGLTWWLALAGFSVVSWTRFGSGNTTGTIPGPSKLAADRVAKASGLGDTLALRARRDRY